MHLSLLEFLRHILDETSFCLRQTQGMDFNVFVNDETLSRAVIRSLEIIGEASKNIPEDFKIQYPLVAWKEMAGMRDRLIHHYFGVDYETVWNTLQNDIPELDFWIKQIIETESSAK
jgi:uncharacterized protein with HEPN domain